MKEKIWLISPTSWIHISHLLSSISIFQFNGRPLLVKKNVMISTVELNPYPTGFIRSFPLHSPKSDTLIKMLAFVFKKVWEDNLRKIVSEHSVLLYKFLKIWKWSLFWGLFTNENSIAVLGENTTTTYWHTLYIKMKILLNHLNSAK